MAISLENWIRHKLDESESMLDFALSTDTLRCWLDEYKEMTSKEKRSCSCPSDKWCGECYVEKWEKWVSTKGKSQL